MLHAETKLGISSKSFPSFILNAALIMDVVWFSRNQTIHEGKELVISELQRSVSSCFLKHSMAWVLQSSRPASFWVPPEPNQMKINFNVVIRHSGSYIVVSCRDSSSFLCTMYMEQVKAMEPLLGEAMAAARAMEIALLRRWSKVIF